MREFWKFATLAHGAAGGQVLSRFTHVGGGVTQVAGVDLGGLNQIELLCG